MVRRSPVTPAACARNPEIFRYVGRLCAKAGWQLLACVGASRGEDDNCLTPSSPPVHFPAWLLAARPDTKHAVLALRGSVTPSDWAINSQCETRFLGSFGQCHAGMLAAARSILEDCGARACCVKLREAGYTLTVIHNRAYSQRYRSWVTLWAPGSGR